MSSLTGYSGDKFVFVAAHGSRPNPGRKACFYCSVVSGPTPIRAYVDSFLSF